MMLAFEFFAFLELIDALLRFEKRPVALQYLAPEISQYIAGYKVGHFGLAS